MHDSKVKRVDYKGISSLGLDAVLQYPSADTSQHPGSSNLILQDDPVCWHPVKTVTGTVPVCVREKELCFTDWNQMTVVSHVHAQDNFPESVRIACPRQT